MPPLCLPVGDTPCPHIPPPRLKKGDTALATRTLRPHVGTIFQDCNLFPHLMVGKNVVLARGWSSSRPTTQAPRRLKANKLLAHVGLAEKLDAWTYPLSGGLLRVVKSKAKKA